MWVCECVGEDVGVGGWGAARQHTRALHPPPPHPPTHTHAHAHPQPPPMQDEIYLNGAIVLPHKDIKESVLEPGTIIM